MIFTLSKAFYDRAGRIANFITTCERIHFPFAKRMDTINGELIGGSAYSAFNDFSSVHHTYAYEQQEVMKSACFRNAKTPVGTDRVS